MTWLRRQANSGDPRSFAARMRAKRFEAFTNLLRDMPKPVKIIDLGGTASFWQRSGRLDDGALDITIVNVQDQPSLEGRVHVIKGDAADLTDLDSLCFDVAFSNSVIEHLFTFERQMTMAHEMQRVAQVYWLQTPNYWFPVEPHFHFLGWQWLPLAARVRILQKKACGWRGPCPDRDVATQTVREIRLMTQKDLRACFPRATILPERFFGLTKSWVVIGGVSPSRLPRAL